MDYKQYWQRLDYVTTNKKGNAVFKFKCLICGHVYMNHNNAASHVSKCLKNTKEEESQTKLFSFGIGSHPTGSTEDPSHLPEPIHEESERLTVSTIDEALIRLIAEANIPYTAINSDPWIEFLNAINPNYSVPPSETLRAMIISLAKDNLQDGLNDFKRKVCGMAIDGATLLSRHCYAFVLMNPMGLRLAAIKEVKKQDAITLARSIAEVLRACQEGNIEISGIVSDNAPSLVKALVDNDPKNESTLLALIGSEILRCACSAHTGQLVIADLMKSDILSQFFQDVTSTLDWLKQRKSNLSLKCPKKIPTYVSTRWNTLYTCADYLYSNREIINQFIQEFSAYENEVYQEKLDKWNQKKSKNQPEPPIPPPIEMIPDDWDTFLEPLAVIADFTAKIEQDLALQQQVYIEIQNVLRKLENIDNPIADSMHHFFIQRFNDTADISLAKLAYHLTPVGIAQYRAMPPNEKRGLFKELKTKFLAISAKLPEQEVRFFAAQFRFFMDFFPIDEGDSPFFVFDDLMGEMIHIAGINNELPVDFTSFAKLCKALVSLPASEAMVERAFSAIKSITNDFNKSMGLDLFIALSTLKLTVRYKRKYFFTEPLEKDD